MSDSSYKAPGMTDQLPRTIPTTEAEQVAQMPEWVKVRVAECNAMFPIFVGPDRRPYWSHALTIWEWMPEPIDPDVALAREACAYLALDEETGMQYLSGDHDDILSMRLCLEMARRVRETMK